MSDVAQALDIDLAVAERARDVRRVDVEDAIEDEERGFYAAVLLLLNDLT